MKDYIKIENIFKFIDSSIVEESYHLDFIAHDVCPHCGEKIRFDF